MNSNILLIMAVASVVVLLFGAVMMLRVSDQDEVIATRFEAAHGRWMGERKTVNRKKAAVGAIAALQQLVTGLGKAVVQSGIMPGRTRSELAQTLAGAGFRSPNSLPLFVGSKLAMLFGLPAAAWLATRNMDLQQVTSLTILAAAGVGGLVAPDMIITRMRKKYLAKIEKGLSDALDLMVICSQAGLSLDPSMARVAVELRNVHPEMCQELATTVRELEMMSDSSKALANLGTRTGLESLIRLTSTLSQTLQYGTPLSEALRTLSNEMRTTALTKFEERAARLPVMLTLPMIMFILPTVFMIVGGPAAIQLIHSFNK